MEKQIALLLALLLCSPFLAFAVPGTAKVFPPGSNVSPCTGSTRGSFGKAVVVYPAKTNNTLWENGTTCGKYYCVVCTGGTNSNQPSPCRGKGYTVVFIQGNCPDCVATINMSNEGFAAIADPNVASIIKIDYAQITNINFPCA